MDEDVDTLVQRFLDNELTRAERRALLIRLAEEPLLRRRLLEGEAVLDAVSRLPIPAPASDFVGRTIARLPLVEVPLRSASPRGSRSAVRLVSTLAAAGILLALGFFAGRAQAPPPTAEATGLVSAGGAQPRELHVRLVLVEPNARSVAVAGDFNDWNTDRTPLLRGEKGVWTTTVPLVPGRYHYMFVIDGQRWVGDPLATETSLDGFGGQDSVLDVEV